MKTYIVLLLLFCSSSLSAQQVKIDSLEAVIPSLKDTSKVDALHRLSFAYQDVSPDKGLLTAKEAVDLAEQLGYHKGKAWALNRLGDNYARKSMFEESLKKYLEALTIFENLNYKRGISGTINGIGIVYYYLKNYDKALEYYLKSLKIKEEIGNKGGIAITYTNIGLVYDKLNNYEKALEYYYNALKIDEEIGKLLEISGSWNYIAETYNKLVNYEKALEFFQKSLDVNEKFGLKFRVAESSNSIGITYTKLKEFENAEFYLSKGLNISIELGAKKLIKENYLNYSELYNAKSSYKKALEYHKLYTSLNDSIYTIDSAEKIATLETMFESEKKDKEILLLKAENSLNELDLRQQILLRNSFIGGFALILVMVFLINNRYQIKKKSHLELEEKMLLIKRLEGFLPICSCCKKIRKEDSDSKDMKSWVQMESYISDKTDATFSHGICPDCSEELYPQFKTKNNSN